MFKFYRSVLAAGVVALGLAACGDNVTVQPPPPPSGGGVTSVTVTPANITIGVGQTEQLALNVVADSGVAKTVNWDTGNHAIATVSSTGVVTGVGLGSTSVIATSTANSSISGAAQVTVSNAATFSITPNTLSLAPGQSSNVVATAVLQAGQTASPIVWSSLTPSIATVANGCTTTAGSSTCAITGVSQGSAVITAATTVGGQNLTATVAVTIGAGASISIASVTEGATAGTVPGCSGVVGQAVILTNTNCEIEVNLNFSAGVQRIDSVTVWFQQGATIKKLARQAFGGTVPSTGPLQLQVNTANFTKNVAAGTATVDLWNGPTTLIAQVWPTVGTGGSAINCAIGGGNADPTCSNLSMILNNTDGWAADMTKCDSVIANGVVCAAAVPAVGPGGTNASTGGFAVSTVANAGASYWGGPGPSGQITAELYAVVYNNNPAFPAGSQLNRCASASPTAGAGSGADCIKNVNWTIGSVFANCGDASQSQTATPATPFFRQVFGTGTNATNSCSGYENTGIRRDNVIVDAGAMDAQNNVFPNGPLIPNTVVFGGTPDSNRFDYKAPSNVQRPTGEGWEDQHWVNANWQFNFDGTSVTDNGVGPATSSWKAFASAQGGPFTAFPTAITSGADLPETNTNTTDGFAARAWATDLLGNINKSAVTTTFGVDKTAPLLRYSTIASPSLYASIYTGGGAASVLDSTTYNAFQGLYGANVLTAGAQDLFVGPAAGTNDSVRVEAIDGRSGLFRGIETVNVFAQGGATGATSSVVAVNFTILDPNTATTGFLPATIDGWLPLHAQGVTGGSTNPGYYTTTMYTVDKAGNASGCPMDRATDGANGGACTAAAPAAGNLFARRTLALDPGQPQVTGVSPNNSYVGNAPAVFTLGSQNDLEVIDAKLRLLYPNLTEGDVAGTIPAAGSGGLVWTYALSGTFMTGSGGGSSISSGPAAGSTTAFGFFDPIAKRFDNSIINPSVSPLTLDMFTTNVQETCTGTTGVATGPTTAADCGTTAQFVGDPIPTDAGGFALAIPTNVGVQVRDVFGSWIFNTTASAVTGVSNEFVSPILSATVTAPTTTFGVSYFDPGLGQSCPAGGAVQAPGSPTCVTGNSSINFRADNFLTSGSTKVFRATEALSRSLPIFTRVDLFGLNAQFQWVFIARIVVPNPVSVGAACPAAAPGSTGVVGCDNGLERYWLYTFTGVPSTFTEYRAIGVDATGSGLASTIHN